MPCGTTASADVREKQMVDFTVALFSSLAMLLLMLTGVLLRRRNMVDDQFSQGLSALTLYIALPCMIVNAFLRDYDPELLSMMLQVFLIALAVNIVQALIIARSLPAYKHNKGCLWKA